VNDQIDAPIQSVWRCFADFGDLRGWAPGEPQVELDGPGDRVGTVRSVNTGDGAAVRERLETYDPAARTFSYRIVESPFPFTDYVATVELGELAGGRTSIDWSSTFEPRGMTAEQTIELIERIYQTFIAKLKTTLAET
jgi:hypothetical protein